jgi:hypothetical protein
VPAEGTGGTIIAFFRLGVATLALRNLVEDADGASACGRDGILSERYRGRRSDDEDRKQEGAGIDRFGS